MCVPEVHFSPENLVLFSKLLNPGSEIIRAGRRVHYRVYNWSAAQAKLHQGPEQGQSNFLSRSIFPVSHIYVGQFPSK